MSSPFFTFFIGEEAKPMAIHTALVADQSLALRTLVTGSMKEAQSREATWKDVDEDTFARFAQFVYTGDYSPTSHTLCGPGIDEANPAVGLREVINSPSPGLAASMEGIQNSDSSPITPDDLYDNWGRRMPQKKKSSKRDVLERVEQKQSQPLSFHDRVYPLPTCSAYLTKISKARANTSAIEDYTPIFLGHARLYTLADEYGVNTLKSVVLYKLHATLCLFTPYEARYGDILELLRFTYDHTPARAQLDPLRELVTQYIAQQATPVIDTEQCLSLVAKGGPLARDLFAMLLRRLAQ